MAYADEVTVILRVRNGHFVGTGDVLKEHVGSLPYDLGNDVSLDAVYEIAHDFRRALYIDDEFGLGLTVSEMPTAESIAVTGATVDQGGDSGGVSVVVELLSEKVWDLWVGLFGAWLYDQLKRGQSEDD